MNLESEFKYQFNARIARISVSDMSQLLSIREAMAALNPREPLTVQQAMLRIEAKRLAADR